MPDFVKYVEAEQSSIKRNPVDWRNNPTLGGAWGSSVHRGHQSKAYRASAHELRQRKRALQAGDAAAYNPASGGYKPFEHPEEEFKSRRSHLHQDGGRRA